MNELIEAGKLASSTGASAVAVGGALWSYKLRYLGVGAMLVGGIWALINIRHALAGAISEGLKAFKKQENPVVLQRTERDILCPMFW